MKVPFKDVPGEVPVPDVDALMGLVRERVADKLERGVYTPADLDDVRRLEQDLLERTDFGPAPADDIALLHSSWDPLGAHPFTSHRGAIGTLIVGAKQWLRRLVRPVAAVTLVRQVAFNGAVVRLLTGASHGVQSLEAGHQTLLRRFEELERRNLELQARCERLQDELRNLKDRPGATGAP